MRVGSSVVTIPVQEWGEIGPLIRVDIADDGSPTVVVLESEVGEWTPIVEEGTVGSYRATRSLLVNGADELVELDFSTGARNVLRTGVGGFVTLAPARFVAWTPDSIEDGEPWPFLQRWFLWDRETDDEIAMADGDEVYVVANPTALIAHGPLDPDSELSSLSTSELLLLPEMRSVHLDDEWSVHVGLDDGTRFLELRDVEGGLHVLEPGGTEPRRLTDDYAVLGWVVDGREVRRLVDRTDDGESETQDIVAYAPPDFAPVVVVEDVFNPLALLDDRWLTVRDRAGDHHGELVVVHAATGEVRSVDRDVFMHLGYTPTPSSSSLAPPTLDGPFVYAVRDADFERAGIWIAELAKP